MVPVPFGSPLNGAVFLIIHTRFDDAFAALLIEIGAWRAIIHWCGASAGASVWIPFHVSVAVDASAAFFVKLRCWAGRWNINSSGGGGEWTNALAL